VRSRLTSAAAMCNAACRRLTAGGAGLAVLDEAGIACLSAGYMTCRIGDAADALHRGRMSFANETAQSLGCRTGMAVADASSLLVERAARRPDVPSQPTGDRSEQRSLVVGAEPRVWVLDSASLVTAADAGGVVVTGSHGGLVGGLPSRALKVPAATRHCRRSMPEASRRRPLLARRHASAMGSPPTRTACPRQSTRRRPRLGRDDRPELC
jgi:hypothetical protein